MNKRGGDIVIGRIVIIFLIIFIFISAFIFVASVSGGANVLEKAYAKQIALLLDNAKKETILEIDFEESIKAAEKNKGGVLTFDEKKSLVYLNNGEVKVTLSGEGYSVNYFSDFDASVDFKENKLVLILT
jgi:hypothetical protein